MIARSDSVDRVGMVASTACAIHCATVAVLPTALSAAGLTALLGHHAEWGVTLAAAGLATAALVVGWRRHRAVEPALALGAGIVGLVAARFVEGAGAGRLGTGLAVSAGLVLVLGHGLNLRRRHAVRASAKEPSTCNALE